MLSPHECSVGYVGDAKKLTLLLPRDTYEASVLVAPTPESMVAIVLDGDHPFISFECSGDTNWSGLLIPNVSVEMDETSVFDARSFSPPLGSLVRIGTTLAVSARSEGAMRNRAVSIVTDLPPCRDSFAAGFKRWRIVIGEGLSKRELKTVEIT